MNERPAKPDPKAVSFNEQALAEYSRDSRPLPAASRRAHADAVARATRVRLDQQGRDGLRRRADGAADRRGSRAPSPSTRCTTRRPMGKHHIQVCTNLSCRLRGADEVMSALRRALGDRSRRDHRRRASFRSSEVECLGSCGTAPMMQLDDDVLGEPHRRQRRWSSSTGSSAETSVDDVTSSPPAEDMRCVDGGADRRSPSASSVLLAVLKGLRLGGLLAGSSARAAPDPGPHRRQPRRIFGVRRPSGW